MRLWDVNTGNNIHTLTGHTGDVLSVAFSPDGNTIASGSGDGTVRLWDANTGNNIHTLTGHTDVVNSVVFSPDGNTIASGGGWQDHTVRLWDVNTGNNIRTLEGHTGAVNSVFSSDGNTIASGSSDGTVLLWDMTLFLSVSTPDVTQNVNIPDPNLRAIIEEALGKTSGETITVDDMATLTGLYAADANISNLTGLEAATNLTELDLSGNSITDISPLVANTGLGEGDFVNLDGNPLNDTSLNTHIPTLRSRGVEVSWVEPATVEPADPPVDTESSAANLFEMELVEGLTMISLPLMPSHPYTARTFAEMLGATVVIRLDTERKEFVGFTADQSGDGYPIEGGQGYIVNVPDGGTVSFEGTAWSNTIENTAAAPSANPKSTGWAFVLSGELRETVVGASYTVVAKNHRTGEVATRQVTSDDSDFNTVWADLSKQRVIEAGDTLEVILIDQWDNIVSGPFRQRVGIEDLRKAYLSLSLTVGDVHPAETLLGQNFPNPFNPETWIPYQLEKSADVVLHIYDTPGRMVRTIDLGFKQKGFYMTRSTAAYWDGRNNMGEPVSSGVYFYSLQTPDFSTTRKMLILK